jgi:hypothetical protein
VSDEQFGVGVRDRGEQCKSAPEQRSERDDQLARVAIGQGADEWGGDDVKAEKRAGEISDLDVGQMKLVLHQRLHREQNVAIHVIEQIERRQDEQRVARLEIFPGHRSKEYSTIPDVRRRTSDGCQVSKSSASVNRPAQGADIGLFFRPRPFGYDRRRNATAWAERAFYLRPDRRRPLHHIFEHLVDNVLLKDP